MAGAAGMPYRRFLPPLVLGAACSQALPLLIGVGVVASLNAGGVIALVAIALLTGMVVTVVMRRRRRARPALSADPDL
ncbi:hypothetical protein [Nonomuraea sp. NPDC049784]|uniref:hypothetical protein n=1 Tax=Nonomuraea sp. NPDC049784 TaxID=3154361 RepID=UPI0033F692B2